MNNFIIVVAAFALMGCSVGDEPSARDKTVLIYKTPTCPCCAKYVRYLEANGYSTHVVDLLPSQLASKREALGVAPHQGSCHTSIFQKYVVEGHVPLEAVEHLLATQPAVRGISVPAMPAHSPGMGPRGNKPLPVYILVNTGELPIPFTYPDPALAPAVPGESIGQELHDVPAHSANPVDSPSQSNPPSQLTLEEMPL